MRATVESMEPWNSQTTYAAPDPEQAAIVFDDLGAIYEAESISEDHQTGELIVMGRPLSDGKVVGAPIRIQMKHADAFDLLARAQGKPRDKRFDNSEGSAQ